MDCQVGMVVSGEDRIGDVEEGEAQVIVIEVVLPFITLATHPMA